MIFDCPELGRVPIEVDAFEYRSDCFTYEEKSGNWTRHGTWEHGSRKRTYEIRRENGILYCTYDREKEPNCEIYNRQGLIEGTLGCGQGSEKAQRFFWTTYFFSYILISCSKTQTLLNLDLPATSGCDSEVGFSGRLRSSTRSCSTTTWPSRPRPVWPTASGS